MGGYVKISGIIDESLEDDVSVEEVPYDRQFRSKPAWQKLIVLSGGVIMNFLLAILIFSSILFNSGVPKQAIIENVAEDYPAIAMGLVSGDKIIKINEENISSWEQMTDIIKSHPNKELTIAWENNSQEQNVGTLITASSKAFLKGNIVENNDIIIDTEISKTLPQGNWKKKIEKIRFN